jgi:microcystin-dependent protein
MADLPEVSQWENVYQIEVTDPVQGGTNGTTNVPLKNLTNRTKYLYDQLATAVSGLNSAAASVTNHEGRITSNEADILALKGAVSGYKHCVITALTSNVQPTFASVSFGAASTQVVILANTANPFIASITCGYNAQGLVNKYVYLTSNISQTNDTFSPTGKITLLFPNGTLAIENFVSYNISYLVPSSPANGALWYNMTAERMFKYNGTAWVAYDCLVIGTSTYEGNNGASGVWTLAPTVGRSMLNLFGRTIVPAGTVHSFAGAVLNIPAGYLLANGGVISRTTYADLFAAIGTTYGQGDGSTTFALPDLRGEFLRGLDNSRGVDAGRALGQSQADMFKAHSHVQRYTQGGGPDDGYTIDGSNDPNNQVTTSITTASTGGTETRPRNMAVNFIIKF